MNLQSFLIRPFALGLIAVLSACASGEGGEVALSAPPTGEVEIIPALENPAAEIWRPGYWSLDGGGFSWVSGRVIERPDPTATWTPARWVRHTYGWTFEQGHWQ